MRKVCPAYLFGMPGRLFSYLAILREDSCQLLAQLTFCIDNHYISPYICVKNTNEGPIN